MSIPAPLSGMNSAQVNKLLCQKEEDLKELDSILSSPRLSPKHLKAASEIMNNLGNVFNDAQSRCGNLLASCRSNPRKRAGVARLIGSLEMFKKHKEQTEKLLEKAKSRVEEQMIKQLPPPPTTIFASEEPSIHERIDDIQEKFIGSLLTFSELPVRMPQRQKAAFMLRDIERMKAKLQNDFQSLGSLNNNSKRVREFKNSYNGAIRFLDNAHAKLRKGKFSRGSGHNSFQSACNTARNAFNRGNQVLGATFDLNMIIRQSRLG